MKKRTDRQLAMHVSRVTILWNMLLFLFKLAAGILARSGAMVSDAVHSASDVFSTLIVMAGVKLSKKEADREHPYGHERLECVAAILLAAILFATGLGIGVQGAKKLFSGSGESLIVPGSLALFAAVVSIVVKETMYWYTRAAAKKIHSGALMADAWHHRSDALSSIGSFAGILGARMGFPAMDPMACIVICFFILKAAVDIFVDAVNKMMDRSCGDVMVDSLRQKILQQKGIVRIDEMNTRMFGERAYVDLEICVPGTLSLREAHSIAEAVHEMVEREFPQVKHCMVHVNPDCGSGGKGDEEQNGREIRTETGAEGGTEVRAEGRTGIEIENRQETNAQTG